MKALFVVLLTLFAVSQVHAEPFAQANAADGVVVRVYKEPCQVGAISNLKGRATWHEKGGKVFEGCYGMHPWGVLVFYFDDKTVVLLSPDDFAEVTGT